MLNYELKTGIYLDRVFLSTVECYWGVSYVIFKFSVEYNMLCKIIKLLFNFVYNVKKHLRNKRLIFDWLNYLLWNGMIDSIIWMK